MPTQLEKYQAVCLKVSELNPSASVQDVLTAATELMQLAGRAPRTPKAKATPRKAAQAPTAA